MFTNILSVMIITVSPVYTEVQSGVQSGPDRTRKLRLRAAVLASSSAVSVIVIV